MAFLENPENAPLALNGRLHAGKRCFFCPLCLAGGVFYNAENQDPHRGPPSMSPTQNRISRYFSGTSLEAYLDVRGLLTPEELLPLARQVASRMRALHEQDILHGDLRP